MKGLMDFGIAVILWLQQFHPALDLPFRMITSLGEEIFFLLFLAMLYWCLDRRVGARLTILLLGSAYLNAALKVLAGQPRPVQYDAQVWAYSDVGGSGGFPSGHTQHTTAVWGYLASQLRRTWLWVVAGILMVLVPLSRLYLGVHFPHDLLGGYVLGLGLLLAYLWLEPRAEAWLVAKGLAWQLGLAVVIPLLLILVLFTEDGVTEGATLMGMGIGFALERRWVGFEVGGLWWKRALRFLLGVVVLLSLWGGLRVVFAAWEPALLFRFIRYGLMGLWGGVGAPWAFVRLGLAQVRGAAGAGSVAP